MNIREIMAALEKYIEDEAIWRMQATTLLKLVGEKELDQEKLTKMCHDHAKRGER